MGVCAHSLQENSKPIPELDFLFSGSSKPRYLAIDLKINFSHNILFIINLQC